MKIRIDENGNIVVVARDTETVLDSISIEDNEDLIQNSSNCCEAIEIEFI